MTELVPPREGSELALAVLEVESGSSASIGDGACDTLLFASEGAGTLELDAERHPFPEGTAALVSAGESARVTAGPGGLRALRATIGPAVDRHAPLGERDVVVPLEAVEAGSATGKRSFQVLFGAHNGSTRATLFIGYVPPGRAPWHYHLYDEIVWVRRGRCRVHRSDGRVEEPPEGTAFRLSPREVHVVENAGDTDMALLGLFTPAGSPSAAYLPAGGTEGSDGD